MSTLAAGAPNDGPSPAMGAPSIRSAIPPPVSASASRQVAPPPQRPLVIDIHAASDAASPSIALAPPPFTCAEPVDLSDRSLLSAIVELGKPRITRLVAITALGGLALSTVARSATGASISWIPLALVATACALGTSLCSGGANGLNQVIESEYDALMHRTRRRPIPSGRVSRRLAGAASLLMLAVGAVVLWAFCGQAAAAAALLTAATYVLLYTPLKRVTVLNTWVGTIPGALPPLIGWCAAAFSAASASEAAGWSALAEPGGWSLVALMVVWQIPHFLALAWLHREDYARGKMRMLPVIDPTGRATMLQVVIWSALLLPASLAPWLVLPDRVGPLYAGVALISGLWYFAEAVRLVRDRSLARARRVFLVSVIHLPVLMLALAVSVALA